MADSLSASTSSSTAHLRVNLPAMNTGDKSQSSKLLESSKYAALKVTEIVTLRPGK